MKKFLIVSLTFVYKEEALLYGFCAIVNIQVWQLMTTHPQTWLSYYWSQTSFQMAWILCRFTDHWFHSAVSKTVITWPQVCWPRWPQADHKICNVEHGTNEFQPAIITYPKIMPSPELKYRLILAINIILRENSGKVLTEDMKCDG